MTISVVEQLCETVRASSRVMPRGAKTKSAPPARGATTLDLSTLRGVIDYQPSEFIIQAYAGTPVKEIVSILSERGQYLPFDPMVVEHGATLGGTVAANASGPDRFRYGGVRDFIIGCHFIDGNGEWLSGGGKVVKNAAGFDYPKMFVGSMGTLGVMTDVCFKVFPKPEAYQTLIADFAKLDQTISALYKLTAAPLDINAIDFAPNKTKGFHLFVRIGGLANGLAQRMERARKLIGVGDIINRDEESALWRAASEFEWAGEGECVVKTPITPEKIISFENRIGGLVKHRYSVGGNVAWLSVRSSEVRRYDEVFRALNLTGRVFFGAAESETIGVQTANPFAERVKNALDPKRKFA